MELVAADIWANPKKVETRAGPSSNGSCWAPLKCQGSNGQWHSTISIPLSEDRVRVLSMNEIRGDRDVTRELFSLISSIHFPLIHIIFEYAATFTLPLLAATATEAARSNRSRSNRTSHTHTRGTQPGKGQSTKRPVSPNRGWGYQQVESSSIHQSPLAQWG